MEGNTKTSLSGQTIVVDGVVGKAIELLNGMADAEVSGIAYNFSQSFHDVAKEWIKTKNGGF
jgi:hypothetical protein